MSRKIIREEDHDLGERGSVISPYRERLEERPIGDTAVRRPGDGPPLVRTTDSWFRGGKAAQGSSTIIGDGSAAPIIAELIRANADDAADSQIMALTITPEYTNYVNFGPKPADANIDTVFVRAGGLNGVGPNDPICAVLDFGAGGTQSQAEVDVGAGTTFNVACAYVRALVRLDLGIIAHAPGDVIATRVGGFVTKGPVSGVRPPTRTRYMNPAIPLAPLGVGIVMSVPPFARTVRAMRIPATAPLDITGLNYTAGVNVFQKIEAANEMTNIPIPNDCMFVYVGNLDLVDPVTSLRLVFELAL